MSDTRRIDFLRRCADHWIAKGAAARASGNVELEELAARWRGAIERVIAKVEAVPDPPPELDERREQRA